METKSIDQDRSIGEAASARSAAVGGRSLLHKFLSVCLLIGGDLVGWGGVLSAAAVLYGMSVFSHPQPTSSLLNQAGSLWWFPPLGILFLAFEGLYTQRRVFWDEVRGLWRGATLAHVAATPALLYGFALSPLVLLFTWPCLLALLPVVRLGAKTALSRLGLWDKRVLIAGAGRSAERVLRALENDPLLGYEVVGFLDDNAEQQEWRIRVNGRDVGVLGTLSQFREVFERTACQDMLIAQPDLSEEELIHLLAELQGYQGVESVRIIPGIGHLSLMHVQIDQFLPERLFMVTVSDNLAKPWNQWAKRAFDLAAGSVLMVLSLPFMGLLAWRIRGDSPGPALYIHDRLGQGGQTFRCYKFRTMYIDGDERLSDALNEDPNARWEWEVYRKLKLDDPRITPVGRFLRRWSLDELPQLFNVLKGEMSLIGPRPYLPQEEELAEPELGTILQARPGMTGLWQVTGKNEVPFGERNGMEAWYVRNWSFWLDVIIAIRTVRVVLQGEGAY